jgi:hypothetical protein
MFTLRKEITSIYFSILFSHQGCAPPTISCKMSPLSRRVAIFISAVDYVVISADDCRIWEGPG